MKYFFTVLFVLKLNNLLVKYVEGRNGYMYSMKEVGRLNLRNQWLYRYVVICGRILSLFGHACVLVPIELVCLFFRWCV
jgi:hypothetical protein